MANIRSKIAFLCSSCGDDFPKWNGQCPSCREWGTLSEFRTTNKRVRNVIERESRSLNDILSGDPGERLSTGLKEVDRVLGGGLLSGSLILLGGNPGVGKSTLALHICSGLKRKALYISAEESEEQVALRAKRLKINPDNLFFSGENDLDGILNHLERIQPEMLIVDSIQTIMNSGLDSLPGSPSQIRDCGQRLLETAKHKNVAILIVGHVTKEGTIAGPKMLEHMVDTVLYMEGDDRYDHRMLRSAKNRFGATHEVGIFQMNETGLEEVKNPSEMFLAERSVDVAGTTIYPSLEGTRPILVEVQALVTNANYGTPQRNVNGFDYKRLGMLIAVLEKRMGLAMGTKDVFVNLVGGLKVDDPALDLSIISSIASSTMDKTVNKGVVLCGEVGLAGEVRSINRIEHRLSEAQSLGFKMALVPSSSISKSLKKLKLDIELKPISYVKDAFKLLF
ncbi:MAG: DNA repair protein RadA [Candidatus Marinimicrobia bacterium]|jgi:DNA repair protein RadA/Sms|nr:DNA repair protein RadA [Candidatus Neomarinimicrobiota bacterium]|tara:strand:- start:8874 stop:10226 length:1353 start_codon:yes stop_codon:yes gene_type:complete